MSEFGFRGTQNLPLDTQIGLTAEGRWAMALGIMALLIGLGAAAGGVYIGFASAVQLIALPAGLPAAEPETVAILLVACGAITMLLGAISIYKANEV
ncbi:hypothetical protein KPL78_02615 [Roseomonas sp. HJA6]|uniref:Uncharacterized protein n=1 Tax=Roseomonas alba TaxID=2846776 RepID=A0ABS7A339_9PROT|nr:hypothetical protein [Neoroseomonas alba]MBW6396718.1 hypothetical protein [Neoroseomonas alba]